MEDKINMILCDGKSEKVKRHFSFLVFFLLELMKDVKHKRATFKLL